MPIDPNTGRSLNRNPIMSSNLAFNVGDFPPSYGKAIVALTTVSVPTTSAGLATTSKGIELDVIISDAVTSWDLQVFRTDPGPVDTLVKTFPGVNMFNKDGLFVGPGDHVDLKGLSTKVRAQNQTGGTGTITVNVKETA